MSARVLISILLFMGAVHCESHAQNSSVGHKSVVVRQTAEDQNCTVNCQAREAYITIPHAIGDMLKGGIGARQVKGTPIDGVPTFPRKSIWAGPDENDLAREFDQFVQTNISAYASAMTAWQAQYGLATASHDLIQRISHRGREKRAIVNLITFDNGGYYYNGARVMADDPAGVAQLLYVRAIPLAATSGLPATWNWAGGGNLYHELRAPSFAPGTGFNRVDVGATYDEPFDYSGTSYDPDSRLLCLADKTHPGCGQPQPDVKGLIGSSDATYAVLDYYRRVKPAGITSGTGYAAQLAARVTDRLVTFACATQNDGTYSQVFRYTLRLENRIDRYLVFPDGRHYFIQTFKDVVTPAEVSVPATSAINRLGEYPNLGFRFLNHKTNVFTDNSAYAPNAVALSVVALNQGTCGCALQPNYNETVACSSVNGNWVGTFTRWWTFNAGSCSYSHSDDTSTCTVACPSQPPQSQALTCQQAGYPSGWIGGVTQRRDWSTSGCSYGAWYTTGDTCAAPIPIVPLNISGTVSGGGQVTVSGPGFSCGIDIVNSACASAQVPANSTITVNFSPNFTWGGPGQVFYGIYTFTSNASCTFNNNAVWAPISCTYSTGNGGSIALYAPRCTNATGWTTC